jgi:hypothetical protein
MHKEILLEQMRHTSRTGISKSRFDASSASQQSVMVDLMADQLVAHLEKFVLSEQAGDTVRAEATAKAWYFQKVKPWWIPTFLWKRIPEQQEVSENTVVERATPKWTYPSSNLSFPELGTPVRLLVRDPQWKF